MPVIPPPIPVPALVPTEAFEFDPQVEVDLSEMEGDAPGREEAGTKEGEGKGDGGNSEEGLFRLIPPVPRAMIMPETNEILRGKEIEIWVFVDEEGRVVPDSTRIRPPTSDKDYNKRLIKEAAEWTFRPARRGGKPVATWFPYTISM